MNINLLLASILFLSPFLHAAQMKDKAQQLLQRACQGGAFIAGKNAAPCDSLKKHYKLSLDHFKKCLPNGNQLSILILGPGPCKDTPSYDLLMTYDRVVMIDGNDESVKDWLANPKHAKLAKKTDVYAYDLTGGLYRFIADKEVEIAQALNLDEELCITQGNCGLEHYEKLLVSQNFSLDLAQFKPDVIISWMVTSQLTNESIKFISDIRDRYADSDFSQKIETSNRQPTSINDLLSLAPKINKLNEKYSEQAYFLGIKNSGAKYVFYANEIPNFLLMTDGNTESLIKNTFAQIEDLNLISDSLRDMLLVRDHRKSKVEFENFLKTMQDNFLIKTIANAWPYDEKRQVDIHTFSPKPMCNNCHKRPDTLLKCSSCKSVEYCNRNCQKAHWPVHRDACRQAQKGAPNS